MKGKEREGWKSAGNGRGELCRTRKVQKTEFFYYKSFICKINFRVSVCRCLCVRVCVPMCLYVCLCVCLYVCLYVCVSAYMCGCMCAYVCLYVCLYVLLASPEDCLN